MSQKDVNINISVTFRHTDPTKALKDHATEKLTHCLQKYVSADADAHVILNIEKRDHIAEINVHSGQYDLAAKAVTDDLYSAIDKAVHNVNTQLRKQKEQLTSHKHTPPISEIAP